MDRKHRQLTLLYKYLRQDSCFYSIVWSLMGVGMTVGLEPSFWCWTESAQFGLFIEFSRVFHLIFEFFDIDIFQNRYKFLLVFFLLCGTVIQGALRQLDATVKCLKNPEIQVCSFFSQTILVLSFLVKKIEKLKIFDFSLFFKVWWWIVSQLTPENRKCTEFTTILFASLFEINSLLDVEEKWEKCEFSFFFLLVKLMSEKYQSARISGKCTVCRRMLLNLVHEGHRVFLTNGSFKNFSKNLQNFWQFYFTQ